jgi:hypothetical protein
MEFQLGVHLELEAHEAEMMRDGEKRQSLMVQDCLFYRLTAGRHGTLLRFALGR